MKFLLPPLMVLVSFVANVLAVDIEDLATAVAKDYAPVHSILETDKRLLQEYLRQIEKERRHLDSKGGSINWREAQGALIDLGDEEAMDTGVSMQRSADPRERSVGKGIVTRRSQPLLIPKLVPTVRLNQWKNEYREGLIIFGISKAAARAVEDILAKSSSFGDEVRQWAKRMPFSDKRPEEAAAAPFEVWWAQNQPHFEAKRYDLVRPLQE